MKNTRFLLGMLVKLPLVVVLVFGMTVVGCDLFGSTDEDEDKEFKVSFNSDGGLFNDGSSNTRTNTVKSGETVTQLPSVSKANNTFGGWFTQKNGGGTQFTTATKVTADLTVYAKWTAGSSGGTDAKKIIVTGIPGTTSSANITVLDDGGNVPYRYVAIDEGGIISGNSVTFSSLISASPYGSPFTGSGSYYLLMNLPIGGSGYFYTDGKSWTELGIDSSVKGTQFFAKLPKYNILSATSTIAFDKFTVATDGIGPGPNVQ